MTFDKPIPIVLLFPLLCNHFIIQSGIGGISVLIFKTTKKSIFLSDSFMGQGPFGAFGSSGDDDHLNHLTTSHTY